jgi:hypothetical protein
MTVLNEMLSELVPGKEDASDVQLLTVSNRLFNINYQHKLYDFNK